MIHLQSIQVMQLNHHHPQSARRLPPIQSTYFPKYQPTHDHYNTNLFSASYQVLQVRHDLDRLILRGTGCLDGLASVWSARRAGWREVEGSKLGEKRLGEGLKGEG